EMALDDADIVANFQHGFGNATNLDVGVGPRGFEREIGDDNNLWGDQRLIPLACNLRSILNNFDLIEGDGSRHLARGTRTHDDSVLRRAGRYQRLFEALRQGQHGDENAHGSRDADNGHNRRDPAGSNAAQVIDQWHGHDSYPPQRVHNAQTHR